MHKETRRNTSPFPTAVLPVISSFRILLRRALTTNERSDETKESLSKKREKEAAHDRPASAADTTQRNTVYTLRRVLSHARETRCYSKTIDVPSPFDGRGYTTQAYTHFRHTMDRTKRYESCPNPLRTYLATTRPFRRSRDTQTALGWLWWLVASSELRGKVKRNTAKSIRREKEFLFSYGYIRDVLPRGGRKKTTRI